MPGLNGDEVFNKIVLIKKDIKVLFITGSTEEIDNIKKDVNLIDIFRKPFDNSYIINVIDKISALI